MPIIHNNTLFSINQRSWDLNISIIYGIFDCEKCEKIRDRLHNDYLLWANLLLKEESYLDMYNHAYSWESGKEKIK